MSGAACVVATFELKELEAPSHALETCIRQACRNPLVVAAYSELGNIGEIQTALNKSQYDEDDQNLLQSMLLAIT